MEEARELSDHIMIMHKGKKILQGTPAHLLTKEIEPHVLVVDNFGAENKVTPQANVRLERVGDRAFFYASAIDMLKRQAEALETVHFSVRTTNLEDVFMKATGGTLGEQQ